MPAACSNLRNSRLTVFCLNGEPLPERKIKSWSAPCSPSVVRSCVFRKLSKAFCTKPWSFTTRRLRFRFVSSNLQPEPVIWIVRETLAVPRCQSISLHFRARYSLGLIPVVKASAYSVNHLDSLATDRNRLHSSTLRASISHLFIRGRSTPTQGSSASIFHRTACRNADCRTAFVYSIVRGERPRASI